MKQYIAPAIDTLRIDTASSLTLSFASEVGGKELSNRFDYTHDEEWEDE